MSERRCGSSAHSSRPGRSAERSTSTRRTSSRSGTRRGAPSPAPPIGAAHLARSQRRGSPGARRRGGRGGPHGRLGGAGRPLPAARGARAGSREARGRRAAGAAALGLCLLPGRAVPGTTAGLADHPCATRPVDRRLATARRRGGGAAGGLPALPAHVRACTARRLQRMVLLDRVQGRGGAGAVRRARRRPRGDRRGRPTLLRARRRPGRSSRRPARRGCCRSTTSTSWDLASAISSCRRRSKS